MAIETVGFSADAFRASLQAGGARSNQFLVHLTFPNYVQMAGQAAAVAPFLITAASIPGSSVNQTLVYYRGREVKLAGERVYSPWTITILNDTGFIMRNAFDAWMNGMNNLQDNSGYTYTPDYFADFTVTQLDRNSNPLKSFSIRGAFPIDVSDIQLDHGANDQISTFNVTFAYQDYTTSFDGSADNGAENAGQNSQSTLTF